MRNFNFIWFKEKFFSSPINTFLTISIIYLGFVTIPPLFDWILFDATLLVLKNQIAMVEGLAGYLSVFGLKDSFMVYIQLVKYGE